MSDSLQPHGLQHTSHLCSSPSSRVCSTQVHWVGDAIQPSHPLSPSSPPALRLSQDQRTQFIVWKEKRYDTRRWMPQVRKCLICYREEWKTIPSSSTAEPKRKQHSAVHSLNLNNIESSTSHHYYYTVFFAEMTSLLNAHIAPAINIYCHRLQSKGSVKVQWFIDQNRRI